MMRLIRRFASVRVVDVRSEMRRTIDRAMSLWSRLCFPGGADRDMVKKAGV
jgi:hypothetical protein